MIINNDHDEEEEDTDDNIDDPKIEAFIKS
jgi:hypothetical protein